jgi:hypothetical protein
MECKHSKFINAKTNYAICQTCGSILKISKDSTIPIIKEQTITYTDLNPFDIFSNMKKQTDKIKPIKKSEKYLSSRRDLIDYMKHLNNKFKFSDITLYLGIYIMDLIGHNEEIITGNNLELVAIACLLLSCNIF